MAPSPPLPASPDGWRLNATMPATWAESVERCAGGYFHSPLGLMAGAPPGAPLFCEWWRDGVVQGIAIGVESHCHLSFRRRHLYFPTWPAMVPAADIGAEVAVLVELLRARGAAEVIFDSFAARWTPGSLDGAVTRPRQEFEVPVSEPCEQIQGLFNGNHRRSAMSGARAGWTLRKLRGAEANEVLHTVQQAATMRGRRRGDRIVASLPSAMGHLGAELSAPWGVAVYSAWDGPAALSSALVGWANGRAYYLTGGSTPAGYECHSAVWMHWQIMCELATAGMRSYNLGGAAFSAAKDGEKRTGLQRFKEGFGAVRVECTSARWALSPIHARAHALGKRLRGTRALETGPDYR